MDHLADLMGTTASRRTPGQVTLTAPLLEKVIYDTAAGNNLQKRRKRAHPPPRPPPLRRFPLLPVRVGRVQPSIPPKSLAGCGNTERSLFMASHFLFEVISLIRFILCGGLNVPLIDFPLHTTRLPRCTAAALRRWGDPPSH